MYFLSCKCLLFNDTSSFSVVLWLLSAIFLAVKVKFKFKAKVLSAEEGRVKVEIDVSEELINPFGFLHGGCTATLVDMVTTAALAATPRGLRGVSVDLNIS